MPNRKKKNKTEGKKPAVLAGKLAGQRVKTGSMPLSQRKKLLGALMSLLQKTFSGQNQGELKASAEWNAFKASLVANGGLAFDIAYPELVGGCTPDHANEFKKYLRRLVKVEKNLTAAFMAGTGIVQTESTEYDRKKRKFDNSSTDEKAQAVAEALEAKLITTEQADSIDSDENFSAKLHAAKQATSRAQLDEQGRTRSVAHDQDFAKSDPQGRTGNVKRNEDCLAKHGISRSERSSGCGPGTLALEWALQTMALQPAGSVSTFQCEPARPISIIEDEPADLYDCVEGDPDYEYWQQRGGMGSLS
jgi:hypothetical protein